MSDKSTRINLVLAAALTLFLFYIDEGYYSFKWMLDIGNWFVYFLYVFVFFGLFSLVSFSFKRIRKFVVGRSK